MIHEEKIRVYNKTLNPDLWDLNTFKLKSEIKDALLKIGIEFFEQTELDIDILDIRLVGSSAGFNWTKDSDLDVHVLVDTSKLKMPEEYTKRFVKTLSFKWNTEHERIRVKGHKVEVYIQDITENPEPKRQAAIYSLINGGWVRQPHPQKLNLNKSLIRDKYRMMSSRISKAIQDENVDLLKGIMEDLVKMRNCGLEKDGEFSTENLVFKILRSKGDIGKLKEAINRITDKKMSLTESLILLCESPEFKTLKKNKKPLSDQEREEVVNAQAVWNFGKNGSPSPAVWKSVVNGKTWYVSNTHRCFQAKKNLRSAIKAFHDVVKETS